MSKAPPPASRPSSELVAFWKRIENELGLEVPTSATQRRHIFEHHQAQKAKEFSLSIAAAEQGVGKVEFIDIADFMSRPPVEWVIEGVMQRCGVGQIIAPPGKHKTNLALDMALSICQGLADWMGFKIAHHGPAMYFFLEGGSGGPGRTRAWQSGHGFDGPPEGFYVSESPINLAAPQSVSAMKDAIAAMDVAPAVIVIDTQARATRGVKENEAEEMGKVMETCSKIAKEFNTYVLLVHHTGHDASRGRGSSDQAASVDLWIQVDEDLKFTLKKVKEAEGGAERYFEVVDEADGIYVRHIDSHVGQARADLALQQKVLAYYRDNPGRTKTEGAKAIKGTYARNRDVIDGMIGDSLRKVGTKLYLATDEAVAS